MHLLLAIAILLSLVLGFFVLLLKHPDVRAFACRATTPAAIVPSNGALRKVSSRSASRPLGQGWHKISDAKFGWPDFARIRSIRGLAVAHGDIYVGPRTDHGPCGIRYGQALRFRDNAWEYIGGTADTWSWTNANIDRVNQIVAGQGRVWFGLGGQYRELGSAAIYSFDGKHWRNEGQSDEFFRGYSAVMSISVFRGNPVVGLVAPGVRPPAVALRRRGKWSAISNQFSGCITSFIFDLAEYGGELYLAAIDSGDYCMAGVWRWTGQRWDRVAGKGKDNGWLHSAKNKGVAGVNSLRTYSGFGLVATVSSGTGKHIDPVWRYDGKNWSSVSSEARPDWRQATFFDFATVIGNELYIGGGGGDDSKDGPLLWRLENGRWALAAGRGANGSWKAEDGKPDYRYIYDLKETPRGYVVVFGGDRPGGGDVWIYNRN